ncbi:Putative nuclease [Frankliniella fusca]|uniref:Nuclease n=1 Tax=Frankliniella fusca TaxID=407009 RepID=A0AAE1H7X5_9NEOP|nr:Putative nuclease [Frankliniella fusca]KAK3914163.1 Putative nuclease [Frankliniella fusca]KAK3915841.1 Putative nuclease [Frankliniella fusca]KAK3921956.1 Putative nuclease [Frankliniella fusca]KAK3924369.1 Putative nuclease [Frankliniella fusca]
MISFDVIFLCALYFYANGSYQMPVGRNHDISIAQPTVCKFIESVTDALNRPEVVGRLIKFPRTQQEVDDTIERNRLMGGRLPNTLGYTDGSLIKIKKPSVDQNRRAFIGRKNFASVNVLFTCDRRLYIQNVVARHPGSTHDSHIFALSALRDQMIHINTNIRNCVLIGDSGFALEPWLIVPFARGDEPEEDTPEARFNKALCFDRCHIERAIGCMKERFRAINNERVLHYDPVKACRIVIAITVLHNLCILARVPQYVAQNANNPVVNDENDHVAAEDDILARGRLVRNQMVQQLERMRRKFKSFLSEKGLS